MGHLCVQTVRIPRMGYVTHRIRDLSSFVLFPSSLFISPLFHQSREYFRYGKSIPCTYTFSFYHSRNHHSLDISHTSSKDMQCLEETSSSNCERALVRRKMHRKTTGCVLADCTLVVLSIKHYNISKR